MICRQTIGKVFFLFKRVVYKLIEKRGKKRSSHTDRWTLPQNDRETDPDIKKSPSYCSTFLGKTLVVYVLHTII